jgi:hypothetical protein
MAELTSQEDLTFEEDINLFTANVSSVSSSRKSDELPARKGIVHHNMHYSARKATGQSRQKRKQSGILFTAPRRTWVQPTRPPWATIRCEKEALDRLNRRWRKVLGR